MERTSRSLIRCGTSARINHEPDGQPDETKQSREREGIAPSELDGNPGNRNRGNSAAHARAAVEDRDGHAALFRRKKFRYGFARARPVETFSDAQQKPESAKRKRGIYKAGSDADQRPPDNGNRETQARADDVEKDTAQQPGGRIRELERAKDVRKLSVIEMKLLRDDRSQHRERLAIDVVNRS